MNPLHLGQTADGGIFFIPPEAVTQTFAILAIRGAGKTTTAAVIAEEMYKHGLPWICFDPVGVWWGMRADAKGNPSSYQVVVIGGEHGDIALEKHSGPKIAEALAAENVFAVIDVSNESKNTWRHFLTEFCLQLMQMNPASPRHLFLEEAPEFVPQHSNISTTAQCKEAVERLVRLGRNRGYGCTLISQRPARVDKDVLSQCENLFVMRTTGPHDRRALSEWIEAKATERGLDKFLSGLASLPNGEAWFWSPQWLDKFERVKIRPRWTFHPGATRIVGAQQSGPVALADVGEFVDRLRRQLAKKQVAVTQTGLRTLEEVRKERGFAFPNGSALETGANPLAVEIESLRQQLAVERKARAEMEKRIEAVRTWLKPQFDTLQTLFAQLGEHKPAGSVDRTAYEPWLAKAARTGCRRLLETLLERPELSKAQLGTLAGVSYKTSTFRAYMAWLKRNALVEVDGDTVRLQKV